MNFVSPQLKQQIRQVLRDCGQLAEQMATKQFEVSHKGPDDFVTSIDAALDQQLSVAFSLLFPEDGVITEENAPSRKQFAAGYSRIWCIDPLDGTEDFIHGKREYAVMAGLLQDSQPVAGWVYAPAYDQMFCGGSDWGVFGAIANQPLQPLQVKSPPPPNHEFCPIIIGRRDQLNFGEAISHFIPAAQFYSLGSFGLKVMEVVLGRAGLYLYFNGRVKVWDTAGPLAIARSAGLTCCDLEGRSISFLPADIHPETLAHKQAILIGWSDYIEQLRPKLREAVEDVLQIQNEASGSE